MIGTCKKRKDGKHLEVITTEKIKDMSREIGTCKYCKKVKKYEIKKWKEEYNQFHMDKTQKNDIVLMWREAKR